jgi:hypothetical protein
MREMRQGGGGAEREEYMAKLVSPEGTQGKFHSDEGLDLSNWHGHGHGLTNGS